MNKCTEQSLLGQGIKYAFIGGKYSLYLSPTCRQLGIYSLSEIEESLNNGYLVYR